MVETECMKMSISIEILIYVYHSIIAVQRTSLSLSVFCV